MHLNLQGDYQFLETNNKLQDTVAPLDLKYDKKGRLVLKSNKKVPFTGIVNGSLRGPYVIYSNDDWHPDKEYKKFYDRFAQYNILSENACFYEFGGCRYFISNNYVTGTIISGKEEGCWQYRYKYGNRDFLVVTATYKSGKLDGTAKFYKLDGRLYQECEFEKGELVLRIWYNESGEIVFRDTYENGDLIREQFAKDPRNF